MDTASLYKLEMANLSDAAEITRLLAENNLPEEGVIARLPLTLVTKQGDKIVGSAALEIYGRSALLRSVVTAEEARGKGIGQTLVKATLELARQNNVANLYLLTETAASFFTRLGFAPVSRAEVDPALQQSDEFSHACPVSAQAMLLQL